VPDAQINPQSLRWQKAGEAALAAWKLPAADDALETALVIDPRNRSAFVALARVAQRQKLYGQAIRFTNKALALEPNDAVALGVQGEAMVELGAVSRAQQNLAKIKSLCGAKPCDPATSLAALIQRGPAMAKAETRESPKKN
jgi:tetratricopeptide (TPR) repeat protein